MNNKFVYTLNCTLYSLIVFIASNFFVLKNVTNLYWIFLLLYIIVNLFPTFVLPRTRRLKTCAKGNALLMEFLGSTVLSVFLFILSFTRLLTAENMFQNPRLWLVNTLLAIVLDRKSVV